MSIWSISFAYRLGLGFHALNNEGADGSNLMQPRRIDVGEVTYDGISGEIVRRHILQSYVNLCREEGISVLPLSAALHPDRGPIGIRAAAKQLDYKELSDRELFPSTRKAIELCAVLDIGGYLAAWKEQAAGAQQKGYEAEKAYIDTHCAPYKDANPVKRDSCFDVSWLISETPQDLTITQHSAYRDSFALNSRYSQTMRSNVYGGVIRAELHRVGTDNYWYLQEGAERLAVTPQEQRKRQLALVRAIIDYIAAPRGAKEAGWAPHVFLTQGVVLLTSTRTAPFRSPIKVTLQDRQLPVQRDAEYIDRTLLLAKAGEGRRDTWAWSFEDTSELLSVSSQVEATLGEA